MPELVTVHFTRREAGAAVKALSEMLGAADTQRDAVLVASLADALGVLDEALTCSRKRDSTLWGSTRPWPHRIHRRP